LLEIGDKSQKEKYLTLFSNPSNYRLRYAFRLIEDRPDFTPEYMQTIATPVDGGFLISWKKFCTINGDRADLYVVFAKLKSENEAKAVLTGSQVTSDAVQNLGGHGLIQDHPLEKCMKDIKTFSVLMRSRF
jgi:alkylation response protein AidB-like acyl-CoA dehydrogenase